MKAIVHNKSGFQVTFYGKAIPSHDTIVVDVEDGFTYNNNLLSVTYEEDIENYAKTQFDAIREMTTPADTNGVEEVEQIKLSDNKVTKKRKKVSEYK